MTFEVGRYVLTSRKTMAYYTSFDTIDEVKSAWPQTQEEAQEWIDSGMYVHDTAVDWGEYEGKKRHGCVELPEFLLGAPLGQYHCPYCGVMNVAGVQHLDPEEDYEFMTGHEWPFGYYEVNEDD